MNTATGPAGYIEGQKLTTWAVLPGGNHLWLGFAASDGGTHRIVLPLEAVTGLLMTLPRMLRAALDERFPDGSLRVVYPLGDWRVEQAAGGDGLILNLSTRDGFEVAFGLPDEDAGLLGGALLAPTPEQTPTLIRRPN
jgi:hypothetical protein